MRLPQPPVRRHEENVLPLINVVFLLLVFFMLAGQLTRPQPFAAEPPPARGGVAVDAAATVVLLGADGRLAVDESPVARERLTDHVAGLRAARAHAGVVVRADRAAAGADLLEVLEALAAARVERVALMTRALP